jgi:tetratricopeptide (TPR) repeat protein
MWVKLVAKGHLESNAIKMSRVGEGIIVRNIIKTFLFLSAVLMLLEGLGDADRGPIHLRIIVLASESEAQDVLRQLKDGKSFAFLARERSLDEHSRMRYGELQESEVKNLPEVLKRAISNLPDGQISGIVKLEGDRYAIAQVINLQYYRKGAKAFREKDYVTAAANLLQHIEINPDAVKARTMLGKIYEERQENSRAETMYKGAISYNPEYEEAYVYLGSLYLHVGQYQMARMLYGEGLKHLPDSETLKKDLDAVDLLIRKEKIPEESVYLRIIILASTTEAKDALEEIKQGKPFLYVAKERSIDEKNREDYGYLGKVDVKALNASIRTALVGLKEGQVSEIIRLEKDRYAIIQKASVLHYEVGEKAFIAGDLTAAEQNLLRHVELNPDSVKARTMLGKIYEDRQEYEKAEEMYTKAIFFSPKTVLIYERLGRLFLMRGQVQRAKEVYQSGLRQVSDSRILQEGLEMADILLIRERNGIH